MMLFTFCLARPDTTRLLDLLDYEIHDNLGHLFCSMDICPTKTKF